MEFLMILFFSFCRLSSVFGWSFPSFSSNPHLASASRRHRQGTKHKPGWEDEIKDLLFYLKSSSWLFVCFNHSVRWGWMDFNLIGKVEMKLHFTLRLVLISTTCQKRLITERETLIFFPIQQANQERQNTASDSR